MTEELIARYSTITTIRQDDCSPICCWDCGTDLIVKTHAIHTSSSPAFEHPGNPESILAWNNDESWEADNSTSVLYCEGCNTDWELDEDTQIDWEWTD